jgi:hypothetical protein
MKLLILAMALIFNSCASYQPGKGALIVKGNHPKNTPITGYIDKDFTTDHYVLLQFTFGNKTAEWTRIKNISIDLKTKEANSASVVLGQDLNDWSDAIQNKIAIDSHNRAVLLGSIAAAGVVTMGASGNRGGIVAGAALYTGSIAVLAANDIADGISDLERAKMIPKGHLYSPISIPAGLVVKRWILLKIPYDKIPGNIYLDVNYEKNGKVRYELPIKNINTNEV